MRRFDQPRRPSCTSPALASILRRSSHSRLPAPASSRRSRVGSKNFTEQFVLAELYAQALEATGIKVERKINLGGTLIAHKALEEKQIDFYPEYTGTILLAVLKAEPMTDRKAVYDKVKAEYAAKGLVVLNEAPVNNTYNMVVRPETAAQYKLETLTDLAKVAKELKLGAGPEFRDRKDGLPGLKAKYGMEFKEDLQMAIGLRYQALANKQIDVVNGYSTDGMISALKLKRLKDDKNLWPPYYVVPVVRKDALDANPKMADVLNQRERAARRGDDGRDELQGRRREEGAEGRRARFPEGQGHRQARRSRGVAPVHRPRHDAHDRSSTRVTLADVVRGRARGVRRRAGDRGARRASPPRARSSTRSRSRHARSTASTRRSAPTPASRFPPTSSPPTSERAVLRARRGRRSAPSDATSCAR